MDTRAPTALGSPLLTRLVPCTWRRWRRALPSRPARRSCDPATLAPGRRSPPSPSLQVALPQPLVRVVLLLLRLSASRRRSLLRLRRRLGLRLWLELRQGQGQRQVVWGQGDPVPRVDLVRVHWHAPAVLSGRAARATCVPSGAQRCPAVPSGRAARATGVVPVLSARSGVRGGAAPASPASRPLASLSRSPPLRRCEGERAGKRAFEKKRGTGGGAVVLLSRLRCGRRVCGVKRVRAPRYTGTLAVS